MPRILSFVCDRLASVRLKGRCLNGGQAGKRSGRVIYAAEAPVWLCERCLTQKSLIDSVLLMTALSAIRVLYERAILQ